MDDRLNEMKRDRAEWACRKYALRLDAGRGACRRDGDKTAQSENYAAAQARLHQLRTDTGVVLDRYGVPGIIRPFYYDFVMKLARRDRELWVEAHRRAEARVQLDLWAGRGLKREVLLAVAREVLGMDLAAPDPAPCPRLE
jgi:hypothetical protein